MENEITYRIIRSHRRTVALQILRGGVVLIRCPMAMSDSYVMQLVKNKESWIRKRLAQLPKQTEQISAAQLRELADRAGQYISDRVAYYAPLMQVSYGRITIRSQRTRWGSCSSKGNLNFNCLLMLAPPQVVDYVVVHELSHLAHMNHSAAFWATVETYMPDYARWRKWLKTNGARLLAQLP